MFPIDFAVANPPLSYKSWMNGLDPANDIYKRFEGQAGDRPFGKRWDSYPMCEELG